MYFDSLNILLNHISEYVSGSAVNHRNFNGIGSIIVHYSIFSGTNLKQSFPLILR